MPYPNLHPAKFLRRHGSSIIPHSLASRASSAETFWFSETDTRNETHTKSVISFIRLDWSGCPTDEFQTSYENQMNVSNYLNKSLFD